MELASDPTECVEGHDERQAQRLLDLGGDEARVEEVRVDEVVTPPGADPRRRPRAELWHERQQLLLGDRCRGTGGHMDDPDSPGELDDLGQRRVVPAGEDIDAVAERGEMPRDLGDVDVLATGVDAAQRRERRRVVRDHRDPAGHRTASASLPAATVEPARGVTSNAGSARPTAIGWTLDGRPVTSSKARVQSRANRSIEKRSTAISRAAAPSLAARPRSARSASMPPTRRGRSVARIPERRSSSTTGISVVAKATIGIPIIIASIMARPRLV